MAPRGLPAVFSGGVTLGWGLPAELLTRLGKRPYSAGVLLRRLGAEGWPSGQWQQTVNLPTYVYVGSNPTPSTTIRKPDETHAAAGAGVAQR